MQYSCLENPMERGTWQATVHGVAKESDTTEHAHMAKYETLFGLSIIEQVSHYLLPLTIQIVFKSDFTSNIRLSFKANT